MLTFIGRMKALGFLGLGILGSSLVYSSAARADLVPYNGHWYGLTSQALPWNAAEAEAVGLGGHLVAINDAAEQQFLEDTFLDGSRDPSQVRWIGLTDEIQEGTFEWSNGDPLTYTNWNTPTSEPNNTPPGEDYVVINWQWAGNEASAIFGSWNDLPIGGQSFGPPGPYLGIIELTSVPEPTSCALLGSGAVTLVCYAFRRARASKR